MSRSIRNVPILLCLILAWLFTPTVRADTLIPDPFIDSYNNWANTTPGVASTGGIAQWKLHIRNQTLMENSDQRLVDGATNAGDFMPFLLIQDSYTTPSDYTYSAELFTSDDDGLGIVFGYVDPDNYFRVSLRQQTSGSLGHTQGISVQKVVGGVPTQLSPAGVGPGNTAFPTQDQINNHKPINVQVSVVGTSFEVSVAGTDDSDNPLAAFIQNISDDDLVPGKVGVYSWGQEFDTGSFPRWGAEFNTVEVRDSTGATTFFDNFENPSPVAFRTLRMVNADGVPMAEVGSDLGNMSFDLNTRRVLDDTNAFDYATDTAPEIDFLGAAVVVDDPGSSSLTDYVMQVRLNNPDNDGIGVLFRVQGDESFYRANFSNEGLDITDPIDSRAPQGLSIQKYDNGTWSEIFRDDQLDPLFVFTPGQDFDLTLAAIGNSFEIKVIDDPDGAANVFDYGTIVDSNDPLLSGSVGFTSWGSGIDAGIGASWGAYGGVAGTPLLVTVPEPSTVLMLVGCIATMGLLRRKAIA